MTLQATRAILFLLPCSLALGEATGRIIHLAADVGSAVDAGRQLADIDNTLHQIQAAEAKAELERWLIASEKISGQAQKTMQLGSTTK